MPRGKILSDFEKGQIVAMKRECMSIGEIARTLNRSAGAIETFVKDPKRCDGRKSTQNATKVKKCKPECCCVRPAREKTLANN